MANKEEEPDRKIKDFGMTTAFVVLMDDGTADVKALKPSDDEIVALTKHWADEMRKQNQ